MYDQKNAKEYLRDYIHRHGFTVGVLHLHAADHDFDEEYLAKICRSLGYRVYRVYRNTLTLFDYSYNFWHSLTIGRQKDKNGRF